LTPYEYVADIFYLRGPLNNINPVVFLWDILEVGREMGPKRVTGQTIWGQFETRFPRTAGVNTKPVCIEIR
jgi:hypothetical protein